MKKQGAMRDAPSEQCDYVFEGYRREFQQSWRDCENEEGIVLDKFQ